MAGRGDEVTRELQLETKHLAFLIVLVLGLCVASFMLGRWVERQNPPPVAAASRAAEENGTVEDEGDVASDLTFFDTLKNDRAAPLQPAAPSEKTARPTTPRPQPSRAAVESSPVTPPRTPDPRRSVNEGVMIQVFASKDKAAADAIRKRLRGKGYTALLVSDAGSWKVRVGPYADREEAERSAAILRAQENLKTWIP